MNSEDSLPDPRRNPEAKPDSTPRPKPEITPEELAAAQKARRSPDPYYFGEQVQDRLKALEKEWERTGGFDTEYMRTFLERLDEEDPPHYCVRACQ
jgi:hypothetical protein